ncbi:beta-ketoacyl-[acyl-carrier-protein] synthase family protein [Paraburkholderia sp.]|uniref:beta-ketoacyl-[acyl-carrier-protein] synthase family protein n=1 Tax=Paraburkholderia sp. TaxID=1926495 RepID=UPI0025D5B123|nr:beta-ketoacyl-[acyl-carrier-protein] synthase family protein [Paraburkholderia sp.]
MIVQRKRVVVTGMGHLSSIASNVPEFKQALLNKVCGIKPSERFAAYFEHANASEVLQDVTYENLTPEVEASLDKAALWAYKVGYEALSQAKADDLAFREKTGLIIGVSSAGTEAYMPVIEGDYEKFSLQKTMISGSFASSSAIVSGLLGLKGGFELVATACTASTNAVGMGFDQIQNGKNPAVLVVGTEPLYLPTFAGFYALHAMKPEPASPFSGNPGMSIGEGAGAILIEEYEHAVARGATILGEIVSYATSGDGYHETAPDPRAEGAVQVMRAALANAQIGPQDIQYVNAHGTGTEANDRCETLAMKKVFPDIADIRVSSTKAYVGHNIGSAGIIELVACFLTLPEGKVLPTLNFTTPRANFDLNYVPNEFQEARVDLFMKNNYAFGGNNCCIVASTRAEASPATHYEPKRVAITGIGAVSSLGHDFQSIVAGVWEARSAGEVSKLIGENDVGFKEAARTLLESFSANEDVSNYLRSKCGDGGIEELLEQSVWLHSVQDLDPRKYLRRFDSRKANAICTFALLAITQAMKQADRKIKRDGHDLGLILGMAKGPQTTVDRYLKSLFPEPTKVRTSEFPGALMNAISTFCSITEGIKGYNTTLATGANAALGALSYAYELVRQDLQPQVLAGGSDENFSKFWAYLQAMEEGLQLTTRPEDFQVYSEEGRGFLPGEGAGILFLEDYQHAKNRGVPVLAEIVGYGKASDGCYFDGDNWSARSASMAGAIRQAMDEAGITPHDVDLICGSSKGTQRSDHIELDAIRSIWGDRTNQVPLVNYTACFGMVDSCVSILNMAVVIEIMKRGEIPPIPYTKKFCSNEFGFVVEPLRKQVGTALVLGSTEGGNHYAFLLKQGA